MNRITKNRTTRLLLLCVVTMVFVGCSTTRRVEMKLHREVYESLGMDEDRRDNFALYKEAASWLHTPYSGGGMTRRGIDCSGLTYMIYKNVYGITLERNSAKILKNNCRRIGKSVLREGDLVFFNTGGKLFNVSHVGIYLKDDKFVHASTSRGVMISNLNEDYFRKTWVCGGRIRN